MCACVGACVWVLMNVSSTNSNFGLDFRLHSLGCKGLCWVKSVHVHECLGLQVLGLDFRLHNLGFKGLGWVKSAYVHECLGLQVMG